MSIGKVFTETSLENASLDGRHVLTADQSDFRRNTTIHIIIIVSFSKYRKFDPRISLYISSHCIKYFVLEFCTVSIIILVSTAI